MKTMRLVSRACIFLAALAAAAPSFAVENLDRGMIALRTDQTSVYLGWRLLADDPAGRVFNVYRSTNGGPPEKLNATPMTAGTNYVDATAKLDQPNAWWITAVALPRDQAPQEGAIMARVELPADAPIR